jgi:hypothetical protein
MGATSRVAFVRVHSRSSFPFVPGRGDLRVPFRTIQVQSKDLKRLQAQTADIDDLRNPGETTMAQPLDPPRRIRILGALASVLVTVTLFAAVVSLSEPSATNGSAALARNTASATAG